MELYDLYEAAHKNEAADTDAVLSQCIRLCGKFYNESAQPGKRKDKGRIVIKKTPITKEKAITLFR